jgi:serine phosphatase RsbU (regulator of sigma subunit)
MRASGDCEELETSGGLLGVFDDEQYEQIEFDLAVNDRMLLYSDGFEQAFPATPADAYERRLPNTRYRTEFDALCREETPTGMIERIAQRLDDQRGSLHQVDDLTLVTLKAGPISAETIQRSSTAESDKTPLKP